MINFFETAPLFIKEWYRSFDDQDYDNTDNFRWALASDPSQVAAFEDAEEHGCCGSHNETITGPDGLKYLVGFNYGH